MEPDRYPWEALEVMARLLASYAGDPDAIPRVESSQPWPKEYPCYRECAQNGAPLLFMTVDRPVHIRGGWGLKCDSDVYIRGPVVLGRGVRLRKGVVITGPCFIGDGVIIGQGCRIKHSIIRREAVIEYSVRVAYSLIGEKAYVGQHAALNHERLDGLPISIGGFEDGGPIETHAENLGLMAGDGSRVGGGAVIFPGTILKSNGIVPEGRILNEPDSGETLL